MSFNVLSVINTNPTKWETTKTSKSEHLQITKDAVG